jgi:hypothetical protein
MSLAKGSSGASDSWLTNFEFVNVEIAVVVSQKARRLFYKPLAFLKSQLIGASRVLTLPE